MSKERNPVPAGNRTTIPRPSRPQRSVYIDSFSLCSVE